MRHTTKYIKLNRIGVVQKKHLGCFTTAVAVANSFNEYITWDKGVVKIKVVDNDGTQVNT